MKREKFEKSDLGIEPAEAIEEPEVFEDIESKRPEIKIFDTYQKELELHNLEKGTIKSSKEFLNMYINEASDKFTEEGETMAREWYENNKRNIVEKGFDWSADAQMSEIKRTINAFPEAQAQIEKSEEYKKAEAKFNKESDYSNMLIADLQKAERGETLDLNSHYLILNFLDNREKRIKGEIEDINKDEDISEEEKENEIKKREKKIKELFKTKKEVAEKIKNRDFIGDAEDELNVSPLTQEQLKFLEDGKDNYIDAHATEEEKEVKKEEMKLEIKEELFPNPGEEGWNILSEKEKKKARKEMSKRGIRYSDGEEWKSYSDLQIKRYTDMFNEKIKDAFGIKEMLEGQEGEEQTMILLKQGYGPEIIKYSGFGNWLPGRLKSKIKLKKRENAMTCEEFKIFLAQKGDIIPNEAERRLNQDLRENWDKWQEDNTALNEKIEKKVQSVIKNVKGKEDKLFEEVFARARENKIKQEYPEIKTAGQKIFEKESKGVEKGSEDTFQHLFSELKGDIKKDKKEFYKPCFSTARFLKETLLKQDLDEEKFQKEYNEVIKDIFSSPEKLSKFQELYSEAIKEKDAMGILGIIFILLTKIIFGEDLEKAL